MSVIGPNIGSFGFDAASGHEVLNSDIGEDSGVDASGAPAKPAGSGGKLADALPAVGTEAPHWPQNGCPTGTGLPQNPQVRGSAEPH